MERERRGPTNIEADIRPIKVTASVDQEMEVHELVVGQLVARASVMCSEKRWTSA